MKTAENAPPPGSHCVYKFTITVFVLMASVVLLLQVTINGLKPNTEYSVKVIAVNGLKVIMSVFIHLNVCIYSINLSTL